MTLSNMDFRNIDLDLLQQQLQKQQQMLQYQKYLQQQQYLANRSQSVTQPPQPSRCMRALKKTNSLGTDSVFSSPAVEFTQNPVLSPLPQTPCISLQRRDSVQSDGSQTDSAAAGRYKTELCRPFEETGHCRYGSKCQFAHGASELRSLNRHPRYKTELCRTFHTTGFCAYGQRCNFIHNEEERKLAKPQVSNQRPQALNINKHQPLRQSVSVGSSGASSPASSVYGGDMSPTHSSNYFDDFSSSFRMSSPTPSYTSDISFPSPTPSSPPANDLLDNEFFTSPLDVGLTISLLKQLKF